MNLFSIFSRKDTQPTQPLTSVRQLHLIVHPGDGVNSRDAQTDRFLLNEMAERAISMDVRDELAIVLLQMSADELHASRDPLFQGKERALIDAVSRVETELPGNVLVLPDAASVRDPYILNTLSRIRGGVHDLGFSIDADTDLIAYGEMATRCVPAAASNMARHFKLRTPPTIDLNYTDVRVDKPELWTRNGLQLCFAQAWTEGAFRYIPIGEKEAA